MDGRTKQLTDRVSYRAQLKLNYIMKQNRKKRQSKQPNDHSHTAAISSDIRLKVGSINVNKGNSNLNVIISLLSD